MRVAVKVAMLLTAEYAAVESATGKLNILGVFNRFEVERLVEPHRSVFLVTRIAGERADSPSTHNLAVKLTDPDGAKMVELTGNFEMPAGAQGIDPECDFVLKFDQLAFKLAGIYRFNVDVDDGAVQASTVIQVFAQEA